MRLLRAGHAHAPRVGSHVPSAHGDDKARADQLQKEGNALAFKKHYAAAVDKYQQALKLEPSWSLLCNVGVAYRLMNQLHRAELYLRRCKASAGTFFPKALAKQRALTSKALVAGNYARITFRVTPTSATIVVSAFGTGEQFSAGESLWLPFGAHTVQVTAPGHVEQSVLVEVKGRTPIVRDISLTTKPVPVPVEKPPKPKQPVIEAPPNKAPVPPKPAVSPPLRRDDGEASNVGLGPRVTVLGGAVGIAAGALFHVLAVRTHDRATALAPRPAGQPYPEYEDELTTFRRQRAAAIGLYVAGTVATGVGAYLWIRARGKAKGSGVRVGVVPASGGGFVFASWSR